MVGRRRDAEKKERRAERHMLLGITYNFCYGLLLSVAAQLVQCCWSRQW